MFNGQFEKDDINKIFHIHTKKMFHIHPKKDYMYILKNALHTPQK